MNILDAIGNTPLIEIKNIWNSDKTGIKIFAKLEGLNPGGSIKDRTALKMIDDAIKNKKLDKGKTILEPTSGNTGIGLAMIGAFLGYKVKLVMPECVSEERKAILKAFGSEIELTKGCEKTDGSIRRANQIIDDNPDKYYMPNQFVNNANWMAHYETTAPEILKNTQSKINCFVAGMGTTGTIMGCSKYFKEKNKNIKIIGIEPEINHKIQGLKNLTESIVPKIYNPKALDDKINCSDENAFETVRMLALKEGIFCGISSGASMWGAMHIARDLPKGTTVVVIFPDKGDRYLSTEMFRSFCAKCPP